jgi:hypothetical protein
MDSKKPLTEKMIILESSAFGNLEEKNVQASVKLEGIISLPRAFALNQNYPNPFNPSTSINFDIPDGNNVQVSLRIYNLRGQLINTLVNEVKEPGSYSIQWDGRDLQGHQAASGIYFYRLAAGEFSKVRKMVLLK